MRPDDALQGTMAREMLSTTPLKHDGCVLGRPRCKFQALARLHHELYGEFLRAASTAMLALMSSATKAAMWRRRCAFPDCRVPWSGLRGVRRKAGRRAVMGCAVCGGGLLGCSEPVACRSGGRASPRSLEPLSRRLASDVGRAHMQTGPSLKKQILVERQIANRLPKLDFSFALPEHPTHVKWIRGEIGWAGLHRRRRSEAILFIWRSRAPETSSRQQVAAKPSSCFTHLVVQPQIDQDLNLLDGIWCCAGI